MSGEGSKRLLFGPMLGRSPLCLDIGSHLGSQLKGLSSDLTGYFFAKKQKVSMTPGYHTTISLRSQRCIHIIISIKQGSWPGLNLSPQTSSASSPLPLTIIPRDLALHVQFSLSFGISRHMPE